jgi:hypothetical protein
MWTNFCCSPSLIFSSPASAKLRLRSNSRSCQRKIKNKPMIKKLKTEYSEFYIISKICSSRTMFLTLYSFVASYSKGIFWHFECNRVTSKSFKKVLKPWQPLDEEVEQGVEWVLRNFKDRHMTHNDLTQTLLFFLMVKERNLLTLWLQQI